MQKTILILFLFLVSCKYDDGYRVEDKRVVYEHHWNAGNGTVITELNADYKTFEVLGDDNMNWAKDAHKVFWGYIHLKFMDADSFEVISINFAKDKEKVICGRDVIAETNPSDFRIRRFTDKTGYTYIYGVDKEAAYLCSTEPNGYTRIVSKSIESFEQLGDGYYRDKEKVYWRSKFLSGVNVSTFKVLSGGYATDGKKVYYTYDEVKGADVQTFEVTSSYRAKDKNHKYFMDEIDE